METTADSAWADNFTDFQAPFVHPEVGEWLTLAED